MERAESPQSRLARGLPGFRRVGVYQHRPDSLSAAFRNLDDDALVDQTRRYEALCSHYEMTPTRNKTGVAHENGAVESQHGHLKRGVTQALLLRGSADFESLNAYRIWIANLIGRCNARYGARTRSAR
jgi:hypothetical protein